MSDASKQGSVLKYALLPTLVVLFLAIFPQLNIWLVKGTSWNGAYVVSNYDEVAYSAYVNALIDGRPRKADPFIGRDDIDKESLYSIQFVPPFVLATAARTPGLSASSVFLALNFLIPVFATLAIFFLIRAVTGDDFLSAVGVIAVLCLGTAVAFQGELQHKILGNYLCDFFPFLRRYQPGFAFPLFFVFCLLVWRSFTRRSLGFALVAGAILAILVFSYFYLWTAALAWLGCFALIWFIFRKGERMTVVTRVGTISAFGLAAIVPFFLMLRNRPQNMDDTQLLNLTHAPNLLALPEIIGFVIIAAIILLVKKSKGSFAAPEVLFAISLAATPFVLFNQQIVTGRSLQPVHYELFIANYLIMIAIVLTIWIAAKSLWGDSAAVKLKLPLLYFGLAAIVWGFIESSATATRNAAYENLRDDAMPALRYLKEQQGPTPSATGRYPTVVSTNLMVADYLSSVTSYRSLWNPHTNSAGGVNLAENKELFYRYLYYSGFDEKDVAKALDENMFEVKAAFFGGGRALSELDKGAMPITRKEVEAALKDYAAFRNQFSREKAADPELSHIVVATKAEPNFEKLDLWYQRDEGKTFGLFKVYSLTLRTN